MSNLSVERCHNLVEKPLIPQREAQHSPTTNCYDNDRDLGSYREMSTLCGEDAD